jgi:putative lipoic acid-binding regulatory protein
MGLLDLFSKERTRERTVNKAINKYAQSPDRLKALQSLAADGSPEALYGMLRRFGMMYDKTIDDEQEKEWVFETLVSKGGVVLDPLKKYMLAADSISWPLRLLDKIVATKDEVVDAIAQVMERHEPGYERDPTKKIQLLNHLAAIKSPRVSALVRPYLADMDEGVRYAAVEAMLCQEDEAAAREPLLEQFVSDGEDSKRLRIRIADGFAQLGWALGDKRAEVEKRLPETFQIVGRGKEPARIVKKESAKG